MIRPLTEGVREQLLHSPALKDCNSTDIKLHPMQRSGSTPNSVVGMMRRTRLEMSGEVSRVEIMVPTGFPLDSQKEVKREVRVQMVALGEGRTF